MSGPTQVRGQPLVALLALAGGWIGGRALTWEPPVLIQEAVASETLHRPASAAKDGQFRFDRSIGPQSLPGGGRPRAESHPLRLAAVSAPGAASPGRGQVARSIPEPIRGAPTWSPGNWDLADLAADRMASMHGSGLLLGEAGQHMPGAGLAVQPEPPSAVGSSVTSGRGAITGKIKAVADPQSPQETGPKRWSGDAWALLRSSGDTALAAGALPATYGASQAGAVLRYRIAPSSDHRPTAYLRSTSTLGAVRQTSAALGLSARPVPSVPIVGALEGRLTDDIGRRRFQPVAMAVTELQPFELAMGMRAEAYGQAGYVGGKFATAFADGQLRADRALLSVGRYDARLGLGLWGGVQKGAGRLDFGPSATVSAPLGRGAFGRLAFDWRFRFLGNANPGSGPAVTLSAGF
ncbi:hypothetical protein [Novosphingobium pentaromativorans]|uniref:Uncharacterized protein n=1 Tax=Novosphingobium pentaromativorans US6-1 TaxID=1088721 RepID=G6E8L6_9SPHN|nr:hypothetical protein [Novosphingobium pentaromativorans]AIT81298.1 hypothetical protein JI59_16685 [Novosphingobium pentaromativorans US6-1]EHJ62090.1 hypothetical protein NSU_0687 [Novosphingobium pentaromativorans US6-1]